MKPIKIRPKTRETVRAVHREPIRVQPNERSVASAKPINTIWERSGWTKMSGNRGDVYTGVYRVLDKQTGRQREFAGRIECIGATCQPFVRRPPNSLHTRHPKHMCFNPQSSGWWRMNWYRGTSNVDETISYMTQLIDEALNLYSR